MAKFTSETARIAGQKSTRGKAKPEPILQDAIKVLFTEGVSILYERRHAGIFQGIKTRRLSRVFLKDYRIIPAATVSFVASSTRMMDPVTRLTL